MIDWKFWTIKEKTKSTKLTNNNVTNNQIFSVLNYLWYEEIIQQISKNNISYSNILQELWKEKASIFFYWYVLCSDTNLEEKKTFLSIAIDWEYHKEFIWVFIKKLIILS